MPTIISTELVNLLLQLIDDFLLTESCCISCGKACPNLFCDEPCSRPITDLFS